MEELLFYYFPCILIGIIGLLLLQNWEQKRESRSLKREIEDLSRSEAYGREEICLLREVSKREAIGRGEIILLRKELAEKVRVSEIWRKGFLRLEKEWKRDWHRRPFFPWSWFQDDSERPN